MTFAAPGLARLGTTPSGPETLSLAVAACSGKSAADSESDCRRGRRAGGGGGGGEGREASAEPGDPSRQGGGMGGARGAF